MTWELPGLWFKNYRTDTVIKGELMFDHTHA